MNDLKHAYEWYGRMVYPVDAAMILKMQRDNLREENLRLQQELKDSKEQISQLMYHQAQAMIELESKLRETEKQRDELLNLLDSSQNLE